MRFATLGFQPSPFLRRVALVLLLAALAAALTVAVIELIDLAAGLLGIDVLRDVNSAATGPGAAAGGAGAGAAAAGSSAPAGGASSGGAGGGNKGGSHGSQPAPSSRGSGTSPNRSGAPTDPRALQNMDPSARAEAEYQQERARVQQYNATHPDQSTSAPPQPSAADQAKATAIKSFWTLGGLSPR